jgi:hypothetical protein
MNTNGLKKFAQNARIKLLEKVEDRLDYVLNTDSAELREQQSQIIALNKELEKTGRSALIEKVAYTWFNRLVALRFMDVNSYQPFRIRVLSPQEGYTQPELLTEAKQGHIPDELDVDHQRINDLLNGSLSSQNPQNEVFRLLLVAACNHLNSIFPFLFEPIEDYTELLLPEDLTSEFSIVQDVREGMPAESCEEVEVVGWLYQFYISEKKDEVFASSGKVTKEEIPAATQLFTPRWIVEYMVQNTIGKLWLQNNPDSSLKEHMDYYIESPTAEAEDYLEIDSPEEITFMDPASGSGHILVYGFELLTKIYEEAGYPQSDIAELILTKNLHGIEIDERAAQLSGLSLMMKARDYYRRTFRKDLTPNVTCLTDLSLSEKEIKEVFDKEDIELTDELLHDLTNMQQATNYGSLIIPHTDQSTLKKVHQKLSESSPDDDLFEAKHKKALRDTVSQLITLGKKYHCVAANPPYMGSGNMNKDLKKFAKNSYPDSKKDLMACFIEKNLSMLSKNGLLGMINQHSWMFLRSYEDLREKLIDNYLLDNLLHLGPRTFPEIDGEVVQNCAFTFSKRNPKSKGVYVRLVNHKSSNEKKNKFLAALDNEKTTYLYKVHQHKFLKIPGYPLGYWAGSNMLKNYEKATIGDEYEPRVGMATANNKRFIRDWYEVDINNIGFGMSSRKEARKSGKKWFPFTKGGEFRKWFGNNISIVNWENDGQEIRNFTTETGRVRSHNYNLNYIFKEGLTWTVIGSNKTSFRYTPKGFLFSNSGYGIWPQEDNNLKTLLGLLNSQVSLEYLRLLSPTIGFESGYIRKIPLTDNLTVIQDQVDQLIKLAKKSWDDFELSIGFKKSPLIKNEINGSIEQSLDSYKQIIKTTCAKTYKLECKTNKELTSIYHVESSENIKLSDITCYKDLTEIADSSNELNIDERKIFSNLMSYCVGCMFGRYSLDKEGLILAKQGETLEDYLKKVEKSDEEVSFLPDGDNIIPVLGEDWFEDDIVGRFKAFLKASFGKENFEKNMAFVEDNITHSDLRKYFNRTFYRDHYKRYNKRPIYWMFSSPNGVFKALVYMHRYTPDTLNRMLNDYLREYKSKLTYRKDHLQEIINSSSDASEVNQAEKEQRKLEEMLRELEEYERKVLMPLATERIELDLDDGVLVNYNKFGQAVEEIRSVNTPKKKKKVKEFDWVDGDEIR